MHVHRGFLFGIVEGPKQQSCANIILLMLPPPPPQHMSHNATYHHSNFTATSTDFRISQRNQLFSWPKNLAFPWKKFEIPQDIAPRYYVIAI